MATIQRPLKTYGNRTYVAEVAAAPSNQDPILANEVDGDIDTMYSAWNGGADTVNIKDGAISRVKLSTTDVLPSLPPVPVATDANKTVVVNSTGTGLILGAGGTFVGATPPTTPQVGQLWWRNDPDGNLFVYYDDGNSKQFVPAVPSSVGPWSVSGSTLTPTDATKNVAVPGSGGSSPTLLMGALTAKFRLQTGGNASWGGTGMNWNPGAGTYDDATKPSWMLLTRSDTDSLTLQRAPAGSTAMALLLNIDNAGNLTISGTSGVLGGSTQKSRVQAASNYAALTANHNILTGTQDDTAQPSWEVQLATGSDQFFINRKAPAGASYLALVKADSAGNITINGATAIKASGTVWANPSDPRLKQDVAPYAAGLADICQLAPITYRLKAQPDGPLCYGFDAEKVRDVFPECVSTTTMKLNPEDEEETEDVLIFDMHPVLVALVNAVKELAGKVG